VIFALGTQWCVAATHCVKAAAAHFAAVPSGHQKTLTLFPASSRGAPHNYYKGTTARQTGYTATKIPKTTRQGHESFRPLEKSTQTDAIKTEMTAFFSTLG
jgi:hypothetical protein